MRAHFESRRSAGQRRSARGQLKMDRKTLDSYLLPILDHILQRPGSELHSRNFPDSTKLKIILHTLWHANLIETDNWNNAGKRYRGNEDKPPEARRFVPKARLFQASILASRFVSSGRDYLLGRNASLRVRRVSAVLPNKRSGVAMPSIVTNALSAGTGLYLDRSALIELMQKHRIPWDGAGVRGMLTATSQEVVPAVWGQNKYGDIYSSGPSIQGLRKLLRPALRSIDHKLTVYDVDFGSFFPRLALCLSGDEQSASDNDPDYYGTIARALHVTRDEAKPLGNAYLNGRDDNSIRYKPPAERERAQKLWPSVVKVLRERYPKLQAYRMKHHGKVTKPVYRRAAEVFMACYEAGLEITGGSAGIPLHDGWIFAATPVNAEAVRQAWQRIAREMTGAEIPVKCRPV